MTRNRSRAKPLRSATPKELFDFDPTPVPRAHVGWKFRCRHCKAPHRTAYYDIDIILIKCVACGVQELVSWLDESAILFKEREKQLGILGMDKHDAYGSEHRFGCKCEYCESERWGDGM